MFCIAHRPRAEENSGPGLVFLPPFAEELNKSRHVLSRFGRRLAECGVTCLIPDYHGTGDSEGRFVDATCGNWLTNGRDAIDFLTAQGHRPIMLGGLRLGASLAVELARNMRSPPHSLVLWQPVATGKSMLTQFLRLVTTHNLQKDQYKDTPSTLRERLKAGQTVEIGGYSLGASLYRSMEQLNLNEMPPPPGMRVDLYAVTPNGTERLPVGVDKLADEWRHANVNVQAEQVAGPAFWASSELIEMPELVERAAMKICADVA